MLTWFAIHESSKHLSPSLLSSQSLPSPFVSHLVSAFASLRLFLSSPYFLLQDFPRGFVDLGSEKRMLGLGWRIESGVIERMWV